MSSFVELFYVNMGVCKYILFGQGPYKIILQYVIQVLSRCLYKSPHVYMSRDEIMKLETNANRG
jgi:hypothetical protein